MPCPKIRNMPIAVNDFGAEMVCRNAAGSRPGECLFPIKLLYHYL